MVQKENYVLPLLEGCCLGHRKYPAILDGVFQMILLGPCLKETIPFQQWVALKKQQEDCMLVGKKESFLSCFKKQNRS